MSEDITKPNTIATFMKANVSKRVSGEAIDAMLKHLNKISLEMSKKSEALCESENRSTILDRDINQAFQTIGGGIEDSPEGIFKAVEKMDAETIGKISILIAKWLKDHKD